MPTDERPVSRLRTWLGRLRLVALVLVTLGATGFFLWFVHPLYPIHKWLFWHYFQAWLLAALWAVMCLSAGFGTLHLVLKNPLPFAEHTSIAFAVGLYEMFLLMFVGGLFGLFGGVFFVVLAILMIGMGAWPAFFFLRRLRRHLRAARARARPPHPWTFVVFAFGLLGLAMMYFLILTPDNISYDSRWQHLGLADHYAAAGGISRSVEGSYIAASPHLAATIYTWALSTPNTMLFDRVILAAHMEFVGFLFTLVGVSAIARRLVPPPRPRHAWAVRFLFPAVLLYDASLSGGADHIAAFFAAPIFLCLLRALREPSWRWLLLLVASLAGAAMTKYTGALLLIGFPIVAMTVRFVIDLVRAAIRRPRFPVRMILIAMGVALGAGLLLTSPHWLKNWIWYGDPVYPLLNAHLSLDPWTQDSAERFQGFLKTQLWRPKATWDGLWESIKVLVTWAFIPNDWDQFHGKLPVFGALFSLGFLMLPFLRSAPGAQRRVRTRRIWLLYAAVECGIFVWYWIHHQDRYLQALMPTIAGGTAAVLTLAWRQHWTNKIALSLLVGISIVWGGDVWFIPTHAMIGSPQKYTLDLVAGSWKKNYDDRLKPYGTYYKLGAKLPKDAVILLHEERMRLGLRRQTVLDNVQNQGGISYGRFRSAPELYDAYRRMGVTHFLQMTHKSWNQDSLAGDFVYFDFVTNVAIGSERIDGFTFARMPAERPITTWRDRALVLGCGGSEYETGVYRLDQLTLPTIHVGAPPPKPQPVEPSSPERAATQIASVDFVALDRRCRDAAAVRGQPFQHVAKRQHFDLWIRERKEPPPKP